MNQTGAAKGAAPVAPQKPAVQLTRVSRWYGEVLGVSDLSLTLGPGVFGLLGPNGAGKSTLLKLISGQIKPDRGRIAVFGDPVWNNPEVNRRLGLCPEADALYREMTGRMFLVWMLRLTGIDRAQAERMAGETLERAGLAGAGHRKIAGYSKGMRQRLKLALAAAHDPDLLLLDEPLSGMDPLGRQEIIHWLRELDREGKKTVLISSHVLHEVEAMTRTIVLLHQGKILAEGDVRRIRELIDRHPHRVKVRTNHPRETASAFISWKEVVSVELKDLADGHGTLEVETVKPDRFYDRLPALMVEQGLEVTELDSTDDNLQAVFSYLVT